MKKLYIYTYFLISKNEMNMKKRRGKKMKETIYKIKEVRRGKKMKEAVYKIKEVRKREKKGIMYKIKIILEYLIPLINLILNFLPVFLS